MAEEIKLELLEEKVLECHGGSYPEEILFRSSRPITDADANEMERLIDPLIKERMCGCDMAELGLDWAVEVDVSKLDQTLVRASIILPCKLEMARSAMGAFLEAAEMELARAAIVAMLEEAMLSQASPPVD